MSKVAAEHKTYEEAKAGIDETLKKMGLDYLDMMIIHSPQPWVEVNQSENRYVERNRAAWKAMQVTLVSDVGYAVKCVLCKILK